MTPIEYATALRRVEALIDLDPEPESAAGMELIRLADAIELYEERIYPMARVLYELQSSGRSLARS